ncbi:hypothetical protein QBC33DRAFT_109605 [Phialemonium atrogriseum]|uniref:RING-type domain-containing protein n=1 Tax=Phialemonium atrogriseum TaxID=1093897 RepID=A0AAJ0BX77_9PEZI|nr:uncharacterized protein QBC33DRAFT_109605 [Phialemonium atrogriseum]KAK1766145.1 hypothetical protein QBC33DRAFT_109605 [Phialemonium atrogriseum]
MSTSSPFPNSHNHRVFFLTKGPQPRPAAMNAAGPARRQASRRTSASRKPTTSASADDNSNNEKPISGRHQHQHQQQEQHNVTAAPPTAPPRPPQAQPQPCPICQEPVGRPTPEGVTEAWSRLPCGHRFGSVCIKRWLGLVADERPACPVCRRTATHLCGHPAVPVVIVGGSGDAKPPLRRGGARAGGKKKNKGFDGGGRGGAAAVQEVGAGAGTGTGTGTGVKEVDVAETVCGYCRSSARVARRRRWGRRRTWPFKLVLGCLYLIRHGRRWRRPGESDYMPPVVLVGMRERDPEWEEWWKEQEPWGV